jgi:hypothetical protein
VECRFGSKTWLTSSLVGHARQARQGRCPHLAHDLATMNFYRDFACAEIGCDLLAPIKRCYGHLTILAGTAALAVPYGFFSLAASAAY